MALGKACRSRQGDNLIRTAVAAAPHRSPRGLIRRQRTLACPGVVHQRRRVVTPDDARGIVLFTRGHAPGFVEVGRGDTRELR